MQLISEHTSVYLTKKGISELGRYDYAAFTEEYGLVPDQIRDLKGLMGDASDNIPGVPGVGEKTALKLLHQYGTVEELYQHLEDFAGKKLGEKLQENQEQCFLSKELATIYCQVPLEFDQAVMARREFDREKMIALYQELELRALLKDLASQYPEPETADMEQETPISYQAQSVIHLAEPEDLQQLVQKQSPQIITLIVNRTPGNIMTARVTSMGLLVEEQPYYIACEGRFSQFAQGLRSWLEDEEITILTDDAKKLYSAFLPEGIGMKALYWDSLLIAYLLNPKARICP